MRNVFFVLIMLLLCTCITAQEDSLVRHGTVKIVKQDVFIETYTDFRVYYNDPAKVRTYDDFILDLAQNNAAGRGNGRIIPLLAVPRSDNDSLFDYQTYFKKDAFIKDIRMKRDETDTVRLLVYVDNKGMVKFTDLTPAEKHEKDLWVYDQKQMEYKMDVVHEKTVAAFKRLAADPWIPARIKTLKKNPSRHKEKYETVNGYMQGILTVIYSGTLPTE